MGQVGFTANDSNQLLIQAEIYDSESSHDSTLSYTCLKLVLLYLYSDNLELNSFKSPLILVGGAKLKLAGLE